MNLLRFADIFITEKIEFWLLVRVEYSFCSDVNSVRNCWISLVFVWLFSAWAVRVEILFDKLVKISDIVEFSETDTPILFARVLAFVINSSSLEQVVSLFELSVF